MKTLTLSLLAILFTTLSFGQSLSDPTVSSQLSDPASTPVYINADRAEVASIERRNYLPSSFAYPGRGERSRGAEECGKYKQMRLIGIILASVGGGLLITGIALEALESSYLINNGVINPGLLGGGIACIILGLGGAGAGIPLAIIGSVKAHRYCGGGRSYMELSTKGNGLALSF